MNFAELKTELFARGTDYLEESLDDVARAERWLNQAYRELCNLYAWPFLHAVIAGTAGAGNVAISDLRKIVSVADSSGGQNPGLRLQRISYEDLVRDGADLNKTGTPEFYWVDGGTTVRAWPIGGTITVRYIKRIAPLTGTQEPIFDEEYHDLIVDGAMLKAYKDSDNFEAAQSLRSEYDRGVAAMARDYLLDSREVQYVHVEPYDG